MRDWELKKIISMTQWINAVIIQSKLIGSNRKDYTAFHTWFVSSSYSTKINQSIIYLFIWTLLSIQVDGRRYFCCSHWNQFNLIQFTKIDKKSWLFLYFVGRNMEMIFKAYVYHSFKSKHQSKILNIYSSALIVWLCICLYFG